MRRLASGWGRIGTRARYPRTVAFMIKALASFRHAALPKLEVHRLTHGKPWLYPEDAHILAVVSDVAPPAEVHHLAIDDIDAIHDYIMDYLKKTPLSEMPS